MLGAVAKLCNDSLACVILADVLNKFRRRGHLQQLESTESNVIVMKPRNMESDATFERGI